MKAYRILSDVASDADIEAAFEWYESEQPGLGLEFLDEIRAAYGRILDGPFKYEDLRSGIRRAITKVPLWDLLLSSGRPYLRHRGSRHRPRSR